MTGRITYNPGQPHRCEGQPAADTLAPGTIWECDDCRQEWGVVTGAQYNCPLLGVADPHRAQPTREGSVTKERMKEWVTVKEASALVGRSERAIYEWIEKTTVSRPGRTVTG